MLPNLDPLFLLFNREVVTSYYNKVCDRFLPSGERYKCAIIFHAFANVYPLYEFNILPTTNPDFQIFLSQQIEKAHFSMLTN